MSFDKDYPNRKDIRNPYYKNGKFDKTCRNHGSCPWCKRARLLHYIKDEENVSDQLNEYFNIEDEYPEEKDWNKYF